MRLSTPQKPPKVVETVKPEPEDIPDPDEQYRHELPKPTAVEDPEQHKEDIKKASAFWRQAGKSKKWDLVVADMELSLIHISEPTRPY